MHCRFCTLSLPCVFLPHLSLAANHNLYDINSTTQTLNIRSTCRRTGRYATQRPCTSFFTPQHVSTRTRLKLQFKTKRILHENTARVVKIIKTATTFPTRAGSIRSSASRQQQVARPRYPVPRKAEAPKAAAPSGYMYSNINALTNMVFLGADARGVPSKQRRVKNGAHIVLHLRTVYSTEVQATQPHFERGNSSTKERAVV